MKLSTYILATISLSTSVLAAPMIMGRSPDIKARSPQGSFIWLWYGEDADPTAESTETTVVEKRSTDIKARSPQGSFIWLWYGEDADPTAESTEGESTA
ncbi:hypothetical protein B0O99DRAFT_747326 [Bisporella sp. PMI_857]|nr:hypothetical protein B0O99DRAFT_747326 [Bisporella sp. PMI_857]